jgi:hypothetical protein
MSTMSMSNIWIRRRCRPMQQFGLVECAEIVCRRGCRRRHWAGWAGWRGHDGETTKSTGHVTATCICVEDGCAALNQRVRYALHNSITRYTTLSLPCNGDMTNRPLRIVPAPERCRSAPTKITVCSRIDHGATLRQPTVAPGLNTKVSSSATCLFNRTVALEQDCRHR